MFLVVAVALVADAVAVALAPTTPYTHSSTLARHSAWYVSLASFCSSLPATSSRQTAFRF